ncbi:glycosyltransferase [Stappia sp. F7233]|uniref:Glycosyltransferase n=1 Tax=Stappia albiluteola TaxID=2758565 RepID=A0A839AFD8_9HYPH|nr:glycosyltransferase [Stappia albiluteola]MBA5778423.1 glycosyltransferase [Stappia albiluteola]
MLSVIIPTFNSEQALLRTLSALVPAAAEGVVREVVVADGGSTDGTHLIADAAGAELIEVAGSQGERLAGGADAARRGEWLMFLAPGSVLEPGWSEELRSFAERAERAGRAEECAAVFRLAVDDFGWQARLVEWRASLGCRLLALPHAGQGLVLSRAFYRGLGGVRAMASRPDRDLARRIGRRRLVQLRSAAVATCVAEAGRAA